jgi:uncharacterized membrane protein
MRKPCDERSCLHCFPEEVREKVLALQKEYLIELGDAVIAVKGDKGRVKLNQMMNLTAAGALSGAFWGMLIGVIFLMPLVGAALGAASGALGGALSDTGINNDFMKDAAAALTPRGAGPFRLIRKMTTDNVLADLRGRRRHSTSHVLRPHKRAGVA